MKKRARQAAPLHLMSTQVDDRSIEDPDFNPGAA